MHPPRARVSHLIASLLAAFFLLAQGAALSHEYDHALHKHEVPCAQHFFAGSLGTGLVANAPSLVTSATVAVFGLPPTSDLPSRILAAYRGRAPPRAV